jgi:hypothetical protein
MIRIVVVPEGQSEIRRSAHGLIDLDQKSGTILECPKYLYKK